ncbi:chloride channel protein [bacterium]|nr:chloride channel protein [bacterium]
MSTTDIMRFGRSVLVFLRRSIFGFIEYVHLSEDTFYLLVALLVGITAGYASIVFRFLIDFFQQQYCGPELLPALSLGFVPLWLKVFIGFCGGLTVGLIIYYWSGESRGAGIPEVMEAVALGGGRIRARVSVVKAVCASLTIGCGGSVGREGPIVQIGSSIGSTIGQILGVSEGRLRIMVACGAAAGIAATFNTPIAGVIFAIEIILGSYAMSTLTPMIFATVFATIIARIHLGEYPFIMVPVYSMVSVYEILTYLGLGILCGLVSLVFLKSIYGLTDYADKIPLKPYWRTAIGLALAGCILHFVPQIYGMGYDSISQALQGHLLFKTMLLYACVKVLSTAISLGCGGSGGIFAPSLFTGALFGGAYGVVMNELLPGQCGPPGAYALVGMGALVSGMTHGPVTTIIMLFELTGDYKMVLPLMIACIMASQLASRLKKESAYTEKLKRRGVTIDRGIETTIMGSLRCKDIHHKELPIVKAETPFQELATRVINFPHHQLYVTDDAGQYLGRINLEGMKHYLNEPERNDQLKAADVMEHGITVTEDTFLTELIRKFGIYDLEEIPVLSDDGLLKGVVSQHDVFRIYSLEILKKEPRGIKFLHRGLADGQMADYVELPEDYQLQSVQVAGNMVGKSCRELQIRARYNVTVLAIKSIFEDYAEDRDIPSPDTVLHGYHRLVIIGHKADLERFKKEMDLTEGE